MQEEKPLLTAYFIQYILESLCQTFYFFNRGGTYGNPDAFVDDDGINLMLHQGFVVAVAQFVVFHPDGHEESFFVRLNR